MDTMNALGTVSPLFAKARLYLTPLLEGVQTSLGQRLLAEGAWVALGQVACAVGALGGIRVLTGVLTPETFGTVSLIVGLMGLGRSLFCLPLLQAAIRFYPEVAGDQAGRLRAVIRFFLIRSVTVLVGLTFLVGIGFKVIENASVLIFMSIAGLFVAESVLSMETSLLTAARKQKVFSVCRAADAWARPGMAALCVLVWGSTAEVVLSGYLLGSGIVLTGLSVFPGQRADTETGEGGGLIDGALLQAVVKYTLPLLALSLVSWVSSVSDRYLIGGLLGVEQAGIYAATYGLVGMPFLAISSIIEITLRPIYFQAISSKNQDLEKKIFTIWMGITLLVCLLGILVVFFLRDWILLFLGERFQTGGELMVSIALGHAFLAVAYIYTNCLYAYKMTKAILLVNATTALIALLAAPLLIWKSGILGAALACPVYYGAEVCIFIFLASYFRKQGILSPV